MNKNIYYWVIAVLIIIFYLWFISYRNTPLQWNRVPFGSTPAEQEYLNKDTTYFNIFDTISVK